MSLTEREWDITHAEEEVRVDDLIQEVMDDLADDRAGTMPEDTSPDQGEV